MTAWGLIEFQKRTVKAVSSLLGRTNYNLIAPSCQKQADKSSCGVFAIAFAVEVALGADPSTIALVKEAQMKDHLKNVYEIRYKTISQNIDI